MERQLIIGLFAEGNTDYRFLAIIIRRTFEEICFDCRGEIRVRDAVINADADNRDDSNTHNKKINPALAAINEAGKDVCKVIVSIVPVYMTEAWTLADKDSFKPSITCNNP